jgi:hypothetical protein
MAPSVLGALGEPMTGLSLGGFHMTNCKSVVFFDTFENSFSNQQHRLTSSFCFFFENYEI